jgi:hypothetical protein
MPIILTFETDFFKFLSVFSIFHLNFTIMSTLNNLSFQIPEADLQAVKDALEIERLKLHKKGLMQGLFPVQIERR